MIWPLCPSMGPGAAPWSAIVSRQSLLLLIVLPCLWAATAKPSMAQIQCFNDETLWANQLADLETFDTNPANLLLATEVGAAPGSNAPLGVVLTFDRATTGLSQSFTLETTNAGYAFIHEDFGIFGLPPFPIFFPPGTLSIGEVGVLADDDFGVRFTDGLPVRAFGFYLGDSDVSIGESLTVFSTSGPSLGSCVGFSVGGRQFIGVISDEAIGRAFFDEEPILDDIHISDFRFGKRRGDLGITKDDGLTSATPGDPLNYIIQVTNFGPVEALGATVTDTFAAPLSGCNWTCTASPGASCSASGSGNIADTVDLPVGATVTYNANCATDITADGPVINSATITPPDDIVDIDSNNDSATDTTLLVPQTDLALGKDDGVTQVNADSELTYTLTVNNLGPLDSTGGTVVDTLPGELSFVSSSSGCSASGGTVTCPFSTLAVGSSTTLTFTARVAASAGGTVTNTATVTGNEADPVGGNDTASHDTLVIAQADLSLSKLDDPDPVTAGSQLTYFLTVTNNGPSESTGGTVTDVLPNRLTFDGSTDCGVGGGNTVTCNFGTLPVGASETLEFLVLVDADASGTVTNTATVSGNEADPVSGNDTSSATTEIIRQADLEVLKVDGGGPVVAGETIQYTVTVNNLGPNDVQSAVVSDTFPTDLDDVRWTCTATPGSSCDAVGSGDINDAVNLLAGGSVIYSVTANVESDATGDLVNQASASNPTGVTDPDLGNNSAAVTTAVIQSADLRLAKEDASGGETVPGGPLTYRLTVTNDGPSDSTGGSVTDSLPAGTTFRSSASGCSDSGTTVTCSFGPLIRGGQRLLVFTVDVDPLASGTLTNTAEVTGLEPDPDTGNNLTSHATLASPQTDLQLEKIGPTTASSGEEFTYTLDVTNGGPSNSTGSTVRDPLPSGLTFVSSADCGQSGGVVSCGVGPLAANASRSLAFAVRLDASVTTSIFNTAEIVADEGDPVLGNNTSTHLLQIDAMADLRLSKLAPATVSAGDLITYTLRVFNDGPADSTGGSVTDTLPEGVAFVASADGCSGVTGAVVCPFGGIAVGVSRDLTFTARTAASASGDLDNRASVGGNEDDPDATNNDAGALTTLQLSADLALGKDDGVAVVVPGENLTYSLTVRNLGPSDSDGGRVDDTLPTGLAFVDSADGCTAVGSDVTCPLGPLAADAQRQLRFTVAVDPGVTMPLVNTATVIGNVPDPDPSNDTASHTTPLAARADLALTKDDGLSEAVAGGQMTYTLTVANLGPSASTGGRVEDVLPPGLTFAGSTDGCSEVSGTVTCAFSTLAARSSLDLSFVVDIAADAEGPIDNQASVVGDDQDLDPANDVASHRTPIVRRADLRLAKDDGVAMAAPGDTLTYSLTVTNDGPSDSAGGRLSDVLADGLAFRGSVDGCSEAAGTVTCPVPPLAVGASAVSTFDVRLDSDLSATVINTARIEGDDPDPDTGNNEAVHATPLSPGADLAIEKTDGKTTTAPGASHRYTITVRNLGPSDDPAATVTDILPAELTDVTWTCQASPGSSCPVSGSEDLNETVYLAADGVLVYTIDGTVGGSVGGTLDNTASVTASLSDPDTANNSANDLTALEALADLRIRKDDGRTAVQPGTSLTYTITVDNDGPSTAVGAVVVDVLPAGLTTATWTCQASGGGSCAAAGSGNLNESITLPRGGRATFTLQATVSPDAVGLLINQASVQAPAGVVDPEPANNQATDINTLDPSADLLLLKTDNRDIAIPGETLTYQLTVRNLGPGDAAGAQVLDLLPQDLQGALWTCSPSAGAACTASGSGDVIDTVAIPAGGEVIYQVTGMVNAATLEGQLLNSASVAPAPGLDDPAPSNNHASDIDDLQARHDLVITKTDGQTAAVPGNPLTYVVTVGNLGPSLARGPQVSDPLPDGLSCVWTCVATNGASCLTGQRVGDLLDHPNLPPMATATYSGSCALAADFDGAASGGQLINTASVAPAVGSVDPVPDNNAATDVNTLAPRADLAVSKTDGVDRAIPGQDVLTYVLSATNGGPAAVVGARVRDTFPPGLQCTWTCDPGTGASCPSGQRSGHVDATVDLDVGSTLVIRADCAIDPERTGTLTNTVTIEPPLGTLDPNGNNDTARDLDTVLQPTVQLVVGKTDDLDEVAPGEALTYRITVRNDGPSDAVGITVEDPMPSSLTDISWSCAATQNSSCSALGTDDIVDLVTLRAGGQLIYEVTARVRPEVPPGMLTNRASVSLPAGLIDPQPADNSATDVTQVLPRVDLAIVKDNGVTAAVPGTAVTYTLEVSNTGPSDAVGARVMDTMPPSVSAVTWSCLPSPGAVCTLLGGGDLDDLVRLPAGGTLVYTLEATVDPAAQGELVNTATVQPATGVVDDNLDNNSAQDIDPLTPRADLRLDKRDGLTRIAPGESLTYVLELFNDGPSDVVGATVEDPFPEVLTCTWSCVASTGASCGTPSTQDGPLLDLVDLRAGSDVTYTAQCRVDDDAVGTILNRATVAAPVGVEDPDPTNNVAADETDLDARTDLVISKDDGRNQASPGETLIYTLVVANPFGPSAVRGATVEDLFPDGMDCLWGCEGHFGALCTPGQVQGDLFDVVDLPVGSQAVYTARCAIDDDASGTLVNSATVTPPVGVEETNPSNNSASDVTTLDGEVDLAITVNDGTTGAAPGDRLTYVVEARQLTGPPTTGVMVRDAFPAALDCLWTCQPSTGAGCSSGQNVGHLEDEINLVSGSQVRYQVVCDIDPEARGTLSNVATLDTPPGIVDGDPTNNTGSDLDTVLIPRADLAVSVSDGRTSVDPGEQLTYDIVVSNVAGPSTALGVAVEDVFPADLTCTWTCDLSGDAVCTAGPVIGDLVDSVDLGAGSSVSYRAVCDVGDEAVGTLLNTVRIVPEVGFDDPIGANNRASDTTSITQVTDLGVLLSDGTTTAVPGEELTYTLTVDNVDSLLPGPRGPLFLPATTVRGVLVHAQVPETLSCTWTCTPSVGATCASGTLVGDFIDTVDLPANGQVVYGGTCAIAAAATGIVEGRASLTLPSGVTDLNPSNNDAEDNTLLTPRADIRLSKSDGTTQVAPGSEVLYVIEASNPVGPSDALGGRVVDAFSASLNCLWTCQGQGGGRCSADAGTGDIDQTIDLPVGAAVTFSALCQVSPAAVGMLSNTANLLPPEDAEDPDLANNTASDLDTALLASADLALSKTDGRTLAAPGAEISYTLLARNDGPSDVDAATVTDDLPDALSCSWSCGGLAGAVCDPTLPDGDLTTQIDLPAGSSVAFNAICRVAPEATGTLINVASLVPPASAVDPHLDNNTAIDDDTVLRPLGDLSVLLDNSLDGAIPGEPVAYQVRLDNDGPSAISGAHLLTIEPPTVSCTWTCLPDAGAVCPGGMQTGPLDAVVDLPAAAGITFDGLCQTDSAATGTLRLEAAVAVPPGSEDPNLDDNQSADEDPWTPRVDLSLTKTDGVDDVAPGGSLTYVLDVHNAGPSDAPGSQVSDLLPPQLTCSWQCAPQGGASCTAATIVGDLQDLADLPALSSVIYTADCTVATGASGTVVNQATVSAAPSVLDVDLANNSDSDTDTLTPRADLSLTKDDGQATALPGDTLTYTLVVRNDGPSDAAAVMVEDLFPPQLTCSWGCDTPTTGCDGGPVAGDLIDSLDLDADAHVTYTAVCMVAADAQEDIVNSASVSAADGLDPHPDNNTDTDTDLLGTIADLAILVVDEPDPVTPGEVLAYGVRVNNLGPAADPQVTFTGLLPTAVTFLGLGDPAPGGLFADGFESADVSRWDNAAAAGSQWSGTTSASKGSIVECDESAGVLTCDLGPLANSGNREVTILVRVDNDASGVLIHTLTVSGQGQDPTSGNDTASAVTSVSAEAGADSEGVATDIPGPPTGPGSGAIPR